MQEDAREVAKATGVDFGDDAVGAIMKKYDTNGDGVFQVNEYAAPPQTPAALPSTSVASERAAPLEDCGTLGRG